MGSTVIKVENVSKLYRLGQVGTGTLSHDFNRWWAQVRGQEDPFQKIGTVNDRTQKGDSAYAWALKDIDFEVQQGEVLGVIGKNGAGKSTLLKLLSRVTGPTTGSIKVKGRIASLLEVGTGFHPELSGRENIYLNGAILGMRKAEITRKFDEIVDFAGVAKYIDTPVKRYSSGMYVRLAFAVAAHLDSDILVLDEVLAVGDAEFQNKCLGKMGDVASKEGRTVLFVSHNMGAVREICKTSLVLESGTIAFMGSIEQSISMYLSRSKGYSGYLLHKQHPAIKWEIKSSQNDVLEIGNDVILNIELESIDFNFKGLKIDFALSDSSDKMIIHSRSAWIDFQFDLEANVKKTLCYVVPNQNLSPGEYFLTVYLYDGYQEVLYFQHYKAFQVSQKNVFGTSAYLDIVQSVTVPPFTIHIQ